LFIGYLWQESQWMLRGKSYRYYSMHNISNSIYLSSQQIVKLYPNPANEGFTIEINDRSVTSCQLYNANGQMITTLNLGGSINTYNISNLRAGFYFIKIPTQNGIITQKMIKI
jgi:hypothetical protein